MSTDRGAIVMNLIAGFTWAACYVRYGDLYWLIGMAAFLAVACVFIYVDGGD